MIRFLPGTDRSRNHALQRRRMNRTAELGRRASVVEAQLGNLEGVPIDPIHHAVLIRDPP
jgi:hypothetical protein